MQPLSHAEFEAVVAEALDTLPERFAHMIENVAISIEEEPTGDDLDLVEDEDEELLGIYRGVPLTERTYGEDPLLPDEVAVFRGPINRFARSRDEAVDEIRDTIAHELGHYFGLEDEDLP
jgi:predicted Zn-dependent protease with MMP-like domain